MRLVFTTTTMVTIQRSDVVGIASEQFFQLMNDKNMTAHQNLSNFKELKQLKRLTHIIKRWNIIVQ